MEDNLLVIQDFPSGHPRSRIKLGHLLRRRDVAVSRPSESSVEDGRCLRREKAGESLSGSRTQQKKKGGDERRQKLLLSTKREKEKR